MPQVGNKKFPYTPSGMKQAANARRDKIAGSIRQDKMYRPDRDGPKRVQQTLPMPGRVSRPNPSQMIKRYPGGKGRGRNPRLPGRRADRRDFLPSPIRRPKPPNRRYL